MGPWRGCYEAAAWPLFAPRVRAVIWGSSEDDLIWLGIVRWVALLLLLLFGILSPACCLWLCHLFYSGASNKHQRPAGTAELMHCA
jgi:hypothetical protein